MNPADRLSPRQRECLRLVWERQAQSKEIGTALGIAKGTVDGYIREAVELLGARDRREAARIAFGNRPPAQQGADHDPAGVSGANGDGASLLPSTETSASSRPWRTRERPRNTLTFMQTIGWIAAIAIGSIVALAAAISIGGAMPVLWLPVLDVLRRLTH